MYTVSFFFLLISILFLLFKKVKQVRNRNVLGVFDGLFIGGIFFIIVPICYSFIIGEIPIIGLKSFSPYKDYLVVIYAMFSVLLFGVFSVLVIPVGDNEKVNISVFQKLFFSQTLLLYFISLIIFFLSSGKLSGNSHWYRGNEEVFQQGSFYVLLGQMHNVGRVIIPGLCLYFQLVYLKNSKVFKAHFIIAIVLIVLELFLTGNRIVILFFLFSIGIPFVIYNKTKILMTLVIVSIPLVIVAKFWPMVRGLLWTQKISIEHVVDIVSKAYEMDVVQDNDIDPILVLTEGSNLTSLKYIVDNFPEKHSYSLGDTMIWKAFGTLIPKNIWQDKPEVLGHLVGEYAVKGISLILNITILGDAWGNFGPFGVFYIVTILYLLQLIIPNKHRELLSSIFFMTSVACWRFDFAFYFVTIYIIMFYLFLLRFRFMKRIYFGMSNLIFKEELFDENIKNLE